MADWIRLNFDYADHRALDEAGWQACALWPRLLCLLRQHGGALTDHQLSPRYLSRRMSDMPEEHVRTGVEALKLHQRLRRGECRHYGPGGREVVVEGWVAPNLCNYGNGPTNGSEIELAEESQDVSNGAYVALPVATIDLPSATSHARAPSRTVPSRSVRSPLSEDQARVWESWKSRHPRAGNKNGLPTKKDLSSLKKALADFVADDLVALIDYAHDSDENGPMWWRGEDPKAKRKWMTSLGWLLGPEKIGDRVQMARDWSDNDRSDATAGHWTGINDERERAAEFSRAHMGLITDTTTLPKSVARRADGVFVPLKMKLYDESMPWRLDMEAKFIELWQSGADKYEHAHYRPLLASHRYPCEPDADDLTSVINWISEEVQCRPEYDKWA